jgi:hypothetical protein
MVWCVIDPAVILYHTMRYAALCIGLMLGHSSFAAENPLSVAKYEHPAHTPQEGTPKVEDQSAEPQAARVSFGAPGSMWWTVGAGVSNNFNRATDLNARVNLSYFIAQDVEVAGELGVWYYGLENDAVGINPASYIRWHFLNKQRMSVYADLGIGVLFTTDDVPSDGTSFNFTPRAGAGITHRLGDSANRFELGVRWAHISNARTSGDGDNPSRDSVMLYGGVIFPF